MAIEKIDNNKLNRLRDDWMEKYSAASRLINQFQQQNLNNTGTVNNKDDATNPMSMNGSIFKASSTDGAYAGTQNTNAVNQNNNSNTTYDSATQQQPNGPDTVPVNGASGTTVTSSALTTPEDANNSGKQNDFTQKKEEAAKKTLEAREKYLDYLSVALSFEPSSSANSVFEAPSSDGSSGVDTTGSNTTTTSVNGNNQTNPANGQKIDADDASDPSKKDMAYQQPDKDSSKETVDKQTLKETERKQEELERQFAKTFGAHEVAA